VEMQLGGQGPWKLGDDLKIMFQPGYELSSAAIPLSISLSLFPLGYTSISSGLETSVRLAYLIDRVNSDRVKMTDSALHISNT